ncbi:permease-like cell division protein FtsX [Nonomuraea recticatena]|uniref:FtsX extracellular domain-containing protein n=1 Tax=Nonomuraea recticatena TaxID=46178 RepID=A0ABN3RYD0_9ACTN
MNSPMEDRLRDALVSAGATVEPETLTPLRTPDRHRRFRVDLRLVAVAAAVAGVAMFLMLRPTHHDAPVLAAGMVPMSWSEGEPEISVYLCKPDSPFPACTDDVPPDRGAIEQALRARPEVKSVMYEDQQAAYEKFRQSQVGHEGRLLELVTAADMPESFRLNMRPGTDWSAVIEAAYGLDGVATVINNVCVEKRAELFEVIKEKIFGSDDEVCVTP